MISAVLWPILAFLLQAPPNCGCEQKPEINVLAVVNGVKIARKDLSIDTLTQISIAQDTVIVARSRQLELKINDLLLEGEAKRRGITTAKLFELEVASKIVPPTEAEAKEFYDEGKNHTQSFSSVKNNIIAQFRAEREAARAREFANSLRATAKIVTANVAVTPPTSEADLARVFANVNGVNITSSDIETALLPMIFQVQQQVYALRKRDLEIRINDILLEQEAKRLGTTPQVLVDQHVNAKLPIITEEQARAYYKANKAQLNRDFADVKPMLMRYLLEQEKQKVLAAYAEQLRNESAVQVYLTEPKPPTLRQLCCNLVD
ncbi:MAG TPA: hypothetical protein VN659_14410 [Pyrinomonadaceae bacterium]|nr:hypothetical protein [Pyrinomonadaceae bacterium]